MRSDPDLAVPLPPLPARRGPYYSYAKAVDAAQPGDVVLVRVPGTWTGRVVRTETEYRLIAVGLLQPECYVCAGEAVGDVA